MVAKDRIELLTRGFSVHSRLLRTYNFNDLAGDIHENCMTALDHALRNPSDA